MRPGLGKHVALVVLGDLVKVSLRRRRSERCVGAAREAAQGRWKEYFLVELIVP